MPPTQSRLVCEYLERISRAVLEEYQSIIKSYVSRRQGIYALYKDDRLHYVGLASNLRGRLHTHLRDRHGKKWNQFSVYLTVRSGHMRELESLFLRIVLPPGNKIKGKFVRARNLKRTLEADIRRYHQAEREVLFGRTPKAKRSKTTLVRRKKVYVLARLRKMPRHLRARYNAKTYKARVLKDGRISLKGKYYTSPAKAGRAITGRLTIGWTFWHYKKAAYDWRPLGELRGG